MRRKKDGYSSFRRFIPQRWFTISNKDGHPSIMYGIGQSEDDGKFYLVIYADGVQVLGPYGTRSLATIIFEEKVSELTEPELERLFQKALTYHPGMNGEQIAECAHAAIDYLRISRADDGREELLEQKALEFYNSHTKEEVFDYLREASTRYREMEAQDNE